MEKSARGPIWLRTCANKKSPSLLLTHSCTALASASARFDDAHTCKYLKAVTLLRSCAKKGPGLPHLLQLSLSFYAGGRTAAAIPPAGRGYSKYGRCHQHLHGRHHSPGTEEGLRD